MNQLILAGATGLIGASVYSELKSKYDIVRLGRGDECEFRVDLSDFQAIKNLRLPAGSTLIHCAGVTDEDFLSNPRDAFARSTIGMATLTETSVACGIRRLIYLSSSHVYGNQMGTIDEDTSASPLSNYAIAHYCAEQILRRSAEKFDSCWVLRPNAVFGEPKLIDKFVRWTLIPYAFPLEAIYNGRIALRSSGVQNRNFVSCKDIAKYIRAILVEPLAEKFTVVNAVGKQTMSVFDFARICADYAAALNGNDCEIVRPKPSDDESKPAFLYKSKHDFSFDFDDVSSFLKQFMTKIFDDFKHGKKYGSAGRS